MNDINVKELLDAHMIWLGKELADINDQLKKINSRYDKHEARISACETDNAVLKDARKTGIFASIIGSISALILAIAAMVIKDRF